MKSISECRLYTFVDTAYLHGRTPALVATQLCEGGSDIIQLRAKGAQPDAVRTMAEEILQVTRKFGVPLVINDHLDIAREVGAEFCHLGQEDFFDAGHLHVRDLGMVKGKKTHSDSSGEGIEYNKDGGKPNLNPALSPPSEGAERENQSATIGNPAIGLSTHAPEQAVRAVAAGPEYIAIGPVYATGTKPTARPVTLDYVRWAEENVRIPWFAIGGINLKTLDEVLAAGARRICVVSAILNRTDVAEACREFKSRMNGMPIAK